MGCKWMSKSMTTCLFSYSGFYYSFFYRFLQNCLINMMSTSNTGARICWYSCCRKNILPPPFFISIRTCYRGRFFVTLYFHDYIPINYKYFNNLLDASIRFFKLLIKSSIFIFFTSHNIFPQQLVKIFKFKIPAEKILRYLLL